MKILITTDLFSTKTNGVVTSVRNLCDELKARGHEVKILTSSDSVRSKRSEDVYYIRSVPLRVYPDVRMPTAYKHRFIREIIEWKPDVIHSQCEFFSFKFAKYISKKTKAPIIHTYHTLYEDYVSYVIPGKRLGNWVVKKLSKTILKDVDTVIAPTHKIEDKLKSYGMTNPISVIPTGINLTQHKIRISKDIRNEKRAEYGIQENTLLLISLGRLGAEKNLCELIN